MLHPLRVVFFGLVCLLLASAVTAQLPNIKTGEGNLPKQLASQAKQYAKRAPSTSQLQTYYLQALAGEQLLVADSLWLLLQPQVKDNTWLHHCLAAQGYMARGHYLAAEAAWLLAAKAAPDAASAWAAGLERARAQLLGGLPRQALATLASQERTLRSGADSAARGRAASDIAKQWSSLQGMQAWALVDAGLFNSADSLLTVLLYAKTKPTYPLRDDGAALALRASATLSQHRHEAKLLPKRLSAAAKAIKGHYGSAHPLYYRAWLAQQENALATDQPMQRSQRLDKIDKLLAKLRSQQDSRYVSLAIWASQLHHQQKNYPKSRAILQPALQDLQRLHPAHTQRQAQLAYRYAEADRAEERHTNAALYNRDALAYTQRYTDTTGLIHGLVRAQQGAIALGKYNFATATQAYQQAIANSSSQRQAQHPDHIAWLDGHGDVLQSESKFDEAAARFREVMKWQEQLWGRNNAAFVTSTDKLGKLYMDQGSYDSAAPQLETALALVIELPNQPLLHAQVLDHLALLYQAKGDYKRSEQYYLESLKLRKRSSARGEPNLSAATVSKLAELYQNMGRYTDAIKLLTQSITLYEKTQRVDDEYIAALSSLALLNMKTGKYKEAEQYADKARGYIKQLRGEASLNYGQAQLLQARVVSEMGRYKEAEILLNSALALHKQFYGDNNINTARVVASLGGNQYFQNQPARAEALLNQALAQTEAAVGREHLDYAGMLAQQAQLYSSQARYAAADSLLERVQNIQRAQLGERHPDFLRTEGILAALYKAMGNYRFSEDAYSGLLKGWKNALGERHPDYAFYLSEYADLQYLKGQPAKARKTYDKVLPLLLAQVTNYFPALSEQEKAEFWNKINTKLERYFLFAISQAAKDPALLTQAYNLRLQTKAMLLNQSTAIRSRIMSSKDQELKDLFENWQAKREYLAKLYTLSKKELQQGNINIDEVEAEANKLEKELSLRSETFATRSDKTQPTWDKVRARLRPAEAAVELIRIRAGKQGSADSVIYAALILDASTSKAPRLVTLTDGRRMERRYLLNYSRSITNKFEDKDSYQRYWAPIESALGNAQVVYLSTDGVYNSISLPALHMPTGGYVLDKYEIHYVSNTRDLLAVIPQQAFEGRTAVLLGNPSYNPEKTDADKFHIPELAGTQQEIDNVKRILTGGGWRTEELTLAQASEANLKQRDNPKLLHIATHGFFYPMADDETTGSVLGMQAGRAANNPLLRSGLFLSNASENLDEERTSTVSSDENGILTAFEVMNMNLDNTELVVLSACETGLGEVRNGEGVYGLQRAFNVAGARHMVMSLWRVNDAVTQEMISLFYQYWVQNKTDLYKAFKNAQQQIRNKYQEPYFWGPFVMVGR